MMKKKCNSCGRVLNIPDNKIPEGKTVFVSCPSCSERIKIIKEQNFSDFDFEESESDDFVEKVEETESSGTTPEEKIAGESEWGSFEEPSSGELFDFIEEEGEMAIVCIEDQELKEAVGKILEYMDFTIFFAENNNIALRELRMRGNFSFIAVEENFSCDNIKNNAVLRYTKRLAMNERREIFVLLLSGTRRTFDRKSAFVHSVNMIINEGHIAKLEDLIKKGMTESDQFYRKFKDILKKGLSY